MRTLKEIAKNIFIALALSVVLFSAGLAIRYGILDSKTSLQDILFWIGALPIISFSFGVFGDFFGKGNASYQLSRSVSSQSSNQRGAEDAADIKSRTKSGLNWILAGLLLWFYSYFM